MIREAVLRALQQARHMAPPAGIVLVASLAAPLAEGAPGDLDPTFGDAGRLELPDLGPVWSLELEDDGDGFLAGGDYFCYYDDCSLTSFTHPFSSSVHSTWITPTRSCPHAGPDTARQPDGKLVGIGRTTQPAGFTLTAFPPATPTSAGHDVRRGGLVQSPPTRTCRTPDAVALNRTPYRRRGPTATLAVLRCSRTVPPTGIRNAGVVST